MGTSLVNTTEPFLAEVFELMIIFMSIYITIFCNGWMWILKMIWWLFTESKSLCRFTFDSLVFSDWCALDDKLQDMIIVRSRHENNNKIKETPVI